MTVIYTPIDIKFDIPDETSLYEWFENNKVIYSDHWSISEGKHEWALLASREQPDDWSTLDVYEKWMKNPFVEIDNASVFFNPDINDKLESLKELILKLPFKQIGAAGLIKQKDEIELHRDTYDPTQPLEPRRYLALLTDVKKNTFYLKNRFDDRKYNIKIHSEYRVFCFNNTDVLHGAYAPFSDNGKILLSVIGILDHEQHEKLLKKSIEKFHDYVQFIKLDH